MIAAFLDRLAAAVFRQRAAVLIGFAAITVILSVFALRTKVDASFEKQLPSDHDYIRIFRQYEGEFGGANRVLIALMVKEGDIFTPEFFESLRAATDEMYYIPGVNRSQVQSLVTPNVRYVEVVEDGFTGGNVIPADFRPTPAGFTQVRANILKSGKLGQLVANDFTGAMISAQLFEIDPATGQRLDYAAVARQLETSIRQKYQTENLSVHIIGFAKVIGDVTEGAAGVLMFFGIAFVITAVLFYVFSQSLVLTALPLFTSLCAVVWQLGLLRLFGFGIDPLSILVPFLVFAIAMSHATQLLRSFNAEFCAGRSERESAHFSFRSLMVPGVVAILTDTVGFLTIYLVKVPIIQELALTASLGVLIIVFTDRMLLPVLLSYVRLPASFRQRVRHRHVALEPLWRRAARTITRGHATIVLLVGAAAFWYGHYESHRVQIGDTHAGVPELRPDSRYNRDSALITRKFNIGVDVLSVIVESVPNGCIDHAVVSLMDEFEGHMRTVPGVHSVTSLASVAKVINAGYNEGSLKWRILPRDPRVLSQAVAPIETATGLLNHDGSVMPVMLFLTDHKASTLRAVTDAVKDFSAAHPSANAQFRLAGGNAGVMAATNEVVDAAQYPMVLWVYGVVTALCFITFGSWRATLCVVAPLIIVSELAFAVMVHLEIGLKPTTLPVVALGAGIGVDYGIYIFSALLARLHHGASFEEALFHALSTMGVSVMFAGCALAIGVGTWALSALKFQADMGVLLAFMFFFNMLGALWLLPALARWLWPARRRAGAGLPATALPRPGPAVPSKHVLHPRST